MTAVLALVHLALFLFLLALLGRLVLDWLQMLARGWRPSGPVLVAAEGVYTVTDPPITALRRAVPPLNLGGVQLDLAFLILLIATSVGLNLVAMAA